MKIGICDDEETQRRQLYALCNKYSEETGIDIKIIEFTSGEEVINYKGDLINILFLDIEMGGIDGIQILQTIEKSKNIWRIVFVSNHQELVFNTFGIKTLSFEPKPIGYERLKKWIDVASEEFNEDVLIKFDQFDTKLQIHISRIIYLEGLKNYVSVHIDEGDAFIVSKNIKYWQDIMHQSSILRIHKSYLVNFDFIENISDKVYLKENRGVLPIGRSYRDNVKNEYEEFLLKKMRNRI